MTKVIVFNEYSSLEVNTSFNNLGDAIEWVYSNYKCGENSEGVIHFMSNSPDYGGCYGDKKIYIDGVDIYMHAKQNCPNKEIIKLSYHKFLGVTSGE